MYQRITALAAISAHEFNHRLNVDESPRASTHQEHGRIFGIFEQQLKTQKNIHNLKKT